MPKVEPPPRIGAGGNKKLGFCLLKDQLSLEVYKHLLFSGIRNTATRITASLTLYLPRFG